MMKRTYILQADDNNFKEALDKFLSAHCKENKANAAFYELTPSAANTAMKIVKHGIVKRVR